MVAYHGEWWWDCLWSCLREGQFASMALDNTGPAPVLDVLSPLILQPGLDKRKLQMEWQVLISSLPIYISQSKGNVWVYLRQISFALRAFVVRGSSGFEWFTAKWEIQVVHVLSWPASLVELATTKLTQRRNPLCELFITCTYGKSSWYESSFECEMTSVLGDSLFTPCSRMRIVRN